MRCRGHITCAREVGNACNTLIGKPEGKRSLGKTRHRWEDDVKTDLRRGGV
jgi:hypothetical protein